MKNKFYTVFLASEKDDFGRSFRVSIHFIYGILIFGIVVIGLAIIGFLRFTKFDELSKELDQLRSYKFQATHLLIDAGIKNPVDIDSTFESILIQFFAEKDSLLPSTQPVNGYVTQGIVTGESHNGIDIAAEYGAKIRAPLSGMVVFTGSNGEMGNTIILSHDQNFFTVYSHNDSNLVSEREIVHQGQVIARVGDSGNSEGPHLHFEIWKSNRILDPRKLIDEYKKKDVSIR